MLDVKKLFPNLSEVYSEDGVKDTYEVADTITKMCKELNAEEIERFLMFIDGGRYSMAYDLFFELEKAKRLRLR